MSLEIYIPFVLFVLVMTGTPGIGNLTMMAIGQTTGFRSAVPFLLGTTVGMVGLNTAVSFGLGGLFLASPTMGLVMKSVGTLYILYLAYKILRMQLSAATTNKRFTFVEGVFIHPLNPKSWAMSVVGFSMLSAPGVALPTQVTIFVLTFLLFQFSCHSLWGWAGAAIVHSLRSKTVLRSTNALLVTLMVGATMYALFT